MTGMDYYLPALLLGWLFFSIIVSIDILHRISVQHRLVPLYKLVVLGLVYLSFFSYIYIAVIADGAYTNSLPYYMIIYLPVGALLVTTGHISLSVLSLTRSSSGFHSLKKLALTYTLGFAVAFMTALIFSMVLKTFLGIEVI